MATNCKFKLLIPLLLLVAIEASNSTTNLTTLTPPITIVVKTGNNTKPFGSLESKSVKSSFAPFKRLNDISSSTQPSLPPSTPLITSTVTSTTTSIEAPVYAHILDFKLIMSSFKPDSNTIEIGYIVNANVTSASSSSHISIDIELNCSCDKTNQTWSKLISRQRITNKTTYAVTPMSPRAQPVPGSFLLCQATATNLNLREQNASNYQSFSRIFLLIDPLPATSLVLKPINATSLELNWQNPVYFYDSLQIVCFLNEVESRHAAYLNQTILNNRPETVTSAVNSNQFLIINNLRPGANYNCTILTLRYENEEFFSTVKSQTVTEITSK